MAKVIVVNDIDPRELGMVLDKVLGESNCPLMKPMMGGMVKVAEGVVSGASLGDLFKSLGINPDNQPKQNPTDKNNKGGNQK